MKRLAVIVFFAAAGLSWMAFRTEDPRKKKGLSIAAAVCWGIVLVGFLV
jgi:hypothetical protein